MHLRVYVFLKCFFSTASTALDWITRSGLTAWQTFILWTFGWKRVGFGPKTRKHFGLASHLKSESSTCGKAVAAGWRAIPAFDAQEKHEQTARVSFFEVRITWPFQMHMECNVTSFHYVYQVKKYLKLGGFYAQRSHAYYRNFWCSMANLCDH